MPRIRLAHWHDGHAPGAEVDVDDDDLPGMVADGRVAEVLPAFAEGGVLTDAQWSAVSEAASEPAADEQAPPPRRRKAAQEE